MNVYTYMHGVEVSMLYMYIHAHPCPKLVTHLGATTINAHCHTRTRTYQTLTQDLYAAARDLIIIQIQKLDAGILDQQPAHVCAAAVEYGVVLQIQVLQVAVA